MRPQYTLAQQEAVFWSLVDCRSVSECWPWLGGRTSNGYGRHVPGFGNQAAHRVAWRLTNRQEIPPGMYICHHCDNPPCCNPSHLWLGSGRDNAQDMANKRRHGRYTQPERTARGERASKAKLTEAQVREIRARYAVGGVTSYQLAAEYGIARKNINAVIRRQTWAHVE